MRAQGTLMQMLAGALALVFGTLAQPAIADPAGRLLDYPHVVAAGLPEQHVTVWLPPDYDASNRRYGVLYMHDGQNLFDPALANFHKVWAADRAMLAAAQRLHTTPFIIVGVWAPGADRGRQYMPADIARDMPEAARKRLEPLANGPVISDAYVAWLAGPLKSWVDTQFRTRADRDHTAIAGSSMGGLISCYAFLLHHEIYGRAACVSSHWPAADPRDVGTPDPAMIALWDRWFATRLGAPDGRKLWLDHGTATLDAAYAPYQQAIDARIAALGWRRGIDWESRVYPGAAHEENAWAARFPEVLTWLLAGA